MTAIRRGIRLAASIILLYTMFGGLPVDAGEAAGCSILPGTESACVGMNYLIPEAACNTSSSCTTCEPNPMKACFFTSPGGQSGEPREGYEEVGLAT